MLSTSALRRVRAFLAALTILPASLGFAQELPKSGVTGHDYFYATSPGGVSQLYLTNVHRFANPVVVGPSVNAVPSRWAHRRRTLGALETAITWGGLVRPVFLTPMGNGVGNGAIHLVDLRTGTNSVLVATGGNPAAYDLAIVQPLRFVFSAEDNGAGGTTLRGYSYLVSGALTPLATPQVTLSGSPSAYVNRIGVDEQGLKLHVPTATGVHIITVSAGGAQMVATSFLPSPSGAPTTNPISFMRGGVKTWIVGTSTFDAQAVPKPVVGGWFAWTAAGALGSGNYGLVPTDLSKAWIPAAGTEELAVVSNGTDSYAYFLLREPPPGTFFIKPSAIGVTRFLGVAAPVTSTILMPDTVGEPFANPSVAGTRVAFEASFGPPFTANPPGGGEIVSIIYTPLDPLGTGNPDGVLGVPAPLGGRISTKGMDRPIWDNQGLRVMAATSHFPGAPNPGIPGLEVLNVPPGQVLDGFSAPHTVVENEPFPNQSILFPSAFLPRDPSQATALNGLAFFGNVFHQGLASIGMPPFGEIGQIQIDPVGFTQSPVIPNFRAILPPSFNDATSSLVPIPGNFGARRTTFNLNPAVGLDGIVMSAAIDDEIHAQRTGVNVRASLGLTAQLAPQVLPLPAGWITTTEFLSH